MPRLESLVPSELNDRQQALYDAIVGGPRGGDGRVKLTDEKGSLRGPFDILLRSPEAGYHVQEIGSYLRFGGKLRGDVRELAIVLVARHWGASFEWAAHARIAQTEGIDAALIDDVRAGRRPVFADSLLQLVHDSVAAMLPTRRISADAYAQLSSALSEEELVELLLVVGYYSLLAVLLEGFEVGPRDLAEELLASAESGSGRH